MALIKCTECRHEVSDKASTCPNCGNPIKPTNGINWKKAIIPIIVFILVAVGVFGAWHLLGSEKSNGNVEITDALSSAIRKYTAITGFHEGYAAVCRNDKWGYINSDGEEVISCKYDGASPFSEGLACVYLGDEDMSIVFIDEKGNTIISGYYGFTANTFVPITFKNGVCYVLDKEANDVWIDKKGNKVDKPQNYNEVFVNDGTEMFEEDGKVGLKDTLGNVLIKAKYSFVDNFSEGLALAYLYCGDETIYGYVDRNGKETFTTEDFAKFTQYTENKRAEEKRQEEERQRQEEELRRQGKEVIITIGADVDGTEFKNKYCSVGEVSTQWDELISRIMKVPDDKIVIFKRCELNDHDCSFHYIGVDVYDKNRNGRYYNITSCGEFTIMGGELFRLHVSLWVGHAKHFEAKYYFREKDKDMY